MEVNHLDQRNLETQPQTVSKTETAADGSHSLHGVSSSTQGNQSASIAADDDLSGLTHIAAAAGHNLCDHTRPSFHRVIPAILCQDVFHSGWVLPSLMMAPGMEGFSGRQTYTRRAGALVRLADTLLCRAGACPLCRPRMVPGDFGHRTCPVRCCPASVALCSVKCFAQM